MIDQQFAREATHASDYAWLDEVVTDQAKQDPDWRKKALSGRGSFTDEVAEPTTQDHR